MASLQKNIASQNFTFCMVNASTGAADTGATVTVRVVKDNGAQAAGLGTVTNSGNGQYNYAPTQAETNANDVGFLLTATGDIPVNIDFHTDLTDSGGNLQVDVTKWNGTAVAAPFTPGIPDVNTKNIAGSAAALDANNFLKIGVEAINGNTVSAAALRNSTLSICWGTASGGTATTVAVGTLNNPSALTDVGQLIGRTIIFLGNTANTHVQAQASNITASTTGVTPTLTFTTITTAPASGDLFVVI